MGAAYLMKGDLTTAVEIGTEALAAAEHTGEPFDLLLAHVSIGTALAYQGNFTQGLEYLEQAIALYEPSEHAAFAYTLEFDRGCAAHSHAANCRSYLGHLDRALALTERSCAQPPVWRGSGSARASATRAAPSSPRSTTGSPKASTRAI